MLTQCVSSWPKISFRNFGYSSHALANTVFIHDVSKLGTEFTSDRVYKQHILNEILLIIFKTVLHTRKIAFYFHSPNEHCT